MQALAKKPTSTSGTLAHTQNRITGLRLGPGMAERLPASLQAT